ncbi:hypothetical protein Tco_0382742 [Tanacetum coccineum]
MDHGLFPFLRCVFPDKAKKLENKASFGKVAQGKAAEGKAAKRKFTQGLDIGIRDEKGCRNLYDYVACKENSKHVDDQDGFTRYDEPNSYDGQDVSGASYRAKDSYEVMKHADISSAGTQVEETKSTTEIALEKRLIYNNHIHFILATIVRDDVGVPDSIVNDNEKAMSIHDYVGVHDSTADDKANTMSVCDDINEADAAADDNAKEEMDAFRSSKTLLLALISALESFQSLDTLS